MAIYLFKSTGPYPRPPFKSPVYIHSDSSRVVGVRQNGTQYMRQEWLPAHKIGVNSIMESVGYVGE